MERCNQPVRQGGVGRGEGGVDYLSQRLGSRVDFSDIGQSTSLEPSLNAVLETADADSPPYCRTVPRVPELVGRFDEQAQYVLLPQTSERGTNEITLTRSLFY